MSFSSPEWCPPCKVPASQLLSKLPCTLSHQSCTHQQTQQPDSICTCKGFSCSTGLSSTSSARARSARLQQTFKQCPRQHLTASLSLTVSSTCRCRKRVASVTVSRSRPHRHCTSKASKTRHSPVCIWKTGNRRRNQATSLTLGSIYRQIRTTCFRQTSPISNQPLPQNSRCSGELFRAPAERTRCSTGPKQIANSSLPSRLNVCS